MSTQIADPYAAEFSLPGTSSRTLYTSPGFSCPHEAYCDGGLAGGTNPSSIGGTWAYVLVVVDGRVKDQKSGFFTPEEMGMEVVGNNLSELIAMLNMLEALPEGWGGKVYSDSQNTIGRVFAGWKVKVGVPDAVKARIAPAVARLGRVEPVLLGGHPTAADLERGVRAAHGGKSALPCSRWNQLCDTLCTEQAQKAMARL